MSDNQKKIIDIKDVQNRLIEIENSRRFGNNKSEHSAFSDLAESLTQEADLFALQAELKANYIKITIDSFQELLDESGLSLSDGFSIDDGFYELFLCNLELIDENERFVIFSDKKDEYVVYGTLILSGFHENEDGESEMNIAVTLERMWFEDMRCESFLEGEWKDVFETAYPEVEPDVLKVLRSMSSSSVFAQHYIENGGKNIDGLNRLLERNKEMIKVADRVNSLARIEFTDKDIPVLVANNPYIYGSCLLFENGRWKICRYVPGVLRGEGNVFNETCKDYLSRAFELDSSDDAIGFVNSEYDHYTENDNDEDSAVLVYPYDHKQFCQIKGTNYLTPNNVMEALKKNCRTDKDKSKVNAFINSLMLSVDGSTFLNLDMYFD